MIGFYFAKELLGSGHDVTILTVGDEGSDKMKKPPFNRFSVSIILILKTSSFVLMIKLFYNGVCIMYFYFKEIVSAGGKTVWGDPAEVGKVVGGAAYDVVLDNNGKDLDTVRSVCLTFCCVMNNDRPAQEAWSRE